ncbi:alpha/beta hydrolase [Ectobacillus funiculus]|uniref:alpha/beta fold hydrolase n=1 Tax=Ectobacillus funiculus TaxID=137993 RepID=UPI00397CE032
MTNEGNLTSVVGRYVKVEVFGEQYEVYFETNANANPNGIPVVCQHTAGNDGRQFRDFLLDEEIAKEFIVFAIDLPRHGKSDPPVNKEFWKEEYKLTRKWFVEYMVQFCKSLNLENPIYMGAAIGGQLGIYLAIEHPEFFRSSIAISPIDISPGFYHEWWDHPQVNGSDAGYAITYGLCGSLTSERQKHLNAWYNSQIAPGVINGDLYFYSIEHDLRGEKLPQIDTDECILYMISGEYDYTALPDKVKAYSERIPGSKFVEMKGLGHYPMIENYKKFKEYLEVVLNDIVKEYSHG